MSPPIPDFTGNLSKAVVYINGSAVNASTYINELYRSSYKPLNGGNNVSNYGATGNGITDDSAAFNAALAASDTVLVPSGTYLLASPVIIGNNKSLIGLSSTSIIKPSLPYGILIRGNNVVIQSLHFVGGLSTQRQYKQDGNFTTSMFNGSVLVDGSGNPVPSSEGSFSILDGGRISINITGPAGTPTGPYYLAGTRHGLIASNRYGVHSGPNLIAGYGALLPRFLLNNGDEYTQGTPSATPYFTGTTGLTLQLTVGRSSNDNKSLTATFDVSALSLFHAVNELASIDTANDENICYIFVQASQNVSFLNNDFALFDAAVLKADHTQNLYVAGNSIRLSFGGITTQNGQNNLFINNYIDNRLMDDTGSLLNHSIIRSHGLAFSFDPASTIRESNDQIVSNEIVGTSWAIESAMSMLKPNASFNIIDAGAVGISLANENGVISNNTITLDSLSHIGIEVPTDGLNSSHDVTVENNSIDMSLSTFYQVGFSATNDGSEDVDPYNFNVSNNNITAPIGFQFMNVRPDSERNILLTNNKVTHLGLPGFLRPSSGSDFDISTDGTANENTLTCIAAIKFWGLNTTVPVSGCP